MKKQQMVFSPGKKLSRTEMMRLQGGVSSAFGIWSCGKDGPVCYASKTVCNAHCPGKGCVISIACIT
jgi:hypothetical protein